MTRRLVEQGKGNCFVSGCPSGNIQIIPVNIITLHDTQEEIHICKQCLQQLLQQNTICFVCGKPCDKIGELNKIGVRKSYCCDCYSKIDKGFVKKYWCRSCGKIECDEQDCLDNNGFDECIASPPPIFKITNKGRGKLDCTTAKFHYTD